MKKLLFGIFALFLIFHFSSCAPEMDSVAVTGVKLSQTSISLAMGSTQQLTATVEPNTAANKSVTWKSSNDAIATVNATGLVTAKAEGTTNITVTTVEGNKTATCTVVVNALFGDDSWYAYYSSSSGPGINLVFMGDGYTAADISAGKYESDMKRAIDAFFAIDPYKTYKSYFNAYIIGAVSNQSGVGTGGVAKDTKFRVYHDAGSRMVAENRDECFAHALKIPGIDLYKSTVILIANSTTYGGTTHYTYSLTIPQRRQDLAICPSDNQLAATVQHEAGGHGFGWLSDEYWSVGSGAVTEEQKERLNTHHELGYSLNVSVTNDPSKVFWQDFIGKPNYPMVGFYEGAYLFEFGAWRSEEHSCMRYNDPYFNAPSRALITRRIKELAGEPFTMEWFMANDNFAIYTRSNAFDLVSRRLLPPLAPPEMF